MAWKLDNQPIADPAAVLAYCKSSHPPQPIDPWYRKANFFRIPTGMSTPGTGAVLMRRAELNRVSITAPVTLEIDSGRGPITLKKIDVTGWENAIPAATDDPGTVVIVRLADRRANVRTFTNAAFNMRNGDASGWITSTLNSGTPWTWQLLFAQLWNAVGGLGTAPSLPFTPDGTPENFAYWQASAPVALDDFLNRIGCTVVYRPDLDTFTVVRLGVAADRDANRTTLEALKTWQSEEKKVDRIVFPEKIRVLFRKASDVLTSGGVDPFYVTDTTVVPPPAGVVAGSLVTLIDDMIGTAANSAARASRALERCVDWARIANLHNPPYLYRYDGFNVEGWKFLGPQGREIAFLDIGNGEATEVSSGEYKPWTWPFPAFGTGGGGAPSTGGGGVAAMITAALVTPGGVELPYYPATADTATAGGPWITGAVCRVVNTGTADLKTGKRYPAVKIGTILGVDVYAAKGAKTEMVKDVTWACVSGTVTLTVTKEFLDIDVW